VLRVRLWSPQRWRQRVLLLISVLEEGEQGIDLGSLFFRRDFGQCGELGGVFALLLGWRDGRDAVGDGAALDCAGEGEGGAEEVFGPGGEDAGVVFGYCLGRMSVAMELNEQGEQSLLNLPCWMWSAVQCKSRPKCSDPRSLSKSMMLAAAPRRWIPGVARAWRADHVQGGGVQTPRRARTDGQACETRTEQPPAAHPRLTG
jgi:hypothetical protein